MRPRLQDLTLFFFFFHLMHVPNLLQMLYTNLMQYRGTLIPMYLAISYWNFLLFETGKLSPVMYLLYFDAPMKLISLVKIAVWGIIYVYVISAC